MLNCYTTCQNCKESKKTSFFPVNLSICYKCAKTDKQKIKKPSKKGRVNKKRVLKNLLDIEDKIALNLPAAEFSILNLYKQHRKLSVVCRETKMPYSSLYRILTINIPAIIDAQKHSKSNGAVIDIDHFFTVFRDSIRSIIREEIEQIRRFK